MIEMRSMRVKSCAIAGMHQKPALSLYLVCGRRVASPPVQCSNYGLKMTNKTWEIRYSLLLLVPRISEMCQISVWNLSENCQLQKTVRKVSEMCLISVWNLSVKKFCQKYVRSNLEMSLKCIRYHKCVRKLSVSGMEICQKTVINISTDRFQTHFW